MSLSRVLLCGVSGLALCASASTLFAADLPSRPAMVTKAPVYGKDSWTWFAEGGAQGMFGAESFVAGLVDPPFSVNPKSWGWQGAVGVDYASATSPWHVSAQFRYGANGSKSNSSTQIATFGGVATAGSNTADRQEHNWAADFMIGRDAGLGFPSQLKVGLRVAEIWGRTSGVASWLTPPPTPVTQTHTYTQTDRFLGVGPRIAVDGSVPLGGALSFDYGVGLAALFGRNTADQTDTVTGGGVACTLGCPTTVSGSGNNVVWNSELQGGLAYKFSRNMKLSANYRYEAYLNGLTGLSAAGTPINLSRAYHGPTVRLTVNY